MIERPGLYKRWPKRKKMLQTYSNNRAEGSGHFVAYEIIKNTYLPDGCLCSKDQNGYPKPVGNVIFLTSDVALLSQGVAYDCLHNMLADQDYQAYLAEWQAYLHLQADFSLISYDYLQHEWGKPLRSHQYIYLTHYVMMIGFLMYMNHMPKALALLQQLKWANQQNYLELFHNNLGFFFMLKLLDAYLGGEPEPWPQHEDFKSVYKDLTKPWRAENGEEPIYEAILALWDTNDLEALRPLLLAACDRHTHHARMSSSKVDYDFADLCLYHFPIEILLLFRLRQAKGLANPVLDHPLMAAPFDHLPDVIGDYSDEMIEAILQRVRHDLPDYDARLQRCMAEV